jgi:hypothetical protein
LALAELAAGEHASKGRASNTGSPLLICAPKIIFLEGPGLAIASDLRRAQKVV